MKQILLEKISHEELLKHMKELYSFMKDNLPKIDRDPKVFFKEDQDNADDFLGKTGFYDPADEKIFLFTTDRHAKDVLRSFAHELIHHEQNCSGMTNKLNMSKTHMPDYAQKDDGLKEAERDAFERGNMLFRKWTDGLKAKRQGNKSMLESKKKKNKKSIKDLSSDADNLARKHARSHLNSQLGREAKEENMKEQEAQENLEEVKNNPYPELFDKKERLMKDAFQKREELIFQELMKRFTEEKK